MFAGSVSTPLDPYQHPTPPHSKAAVWWVTEVGGKIEVAVFRQVQIFDRIKIMGTQNFNFPLKFIRNASV